MLLNDKSTHKIITPREAELISNYDTANKKEANTSIGDNQDGQISQKYCNTINAIIDNIKRIVARYGMDDDEWSEAISSQYFLLSLAEKLQHKDEDYKNLLNKCLSNFRITYTGQLILDNDSLLITPDETTRIIDCMKNEDIADGYYRKSSRTRANNIDSHRMYINFHYGLLIKIVSSEDTEPLRAIKHTCLDNLLNEKSIDSYGGWYPYRVPWITARILISLKDIDYDSYPNSKKVDEIVEKALHSLYQRIYEKEPYWRSGVGNWVSKWESTALCLEALYVWESLETKKDKIEKIITYIFNDVNKTEWLNKNVSFETEESANKVLASVILASVVLRITKTYYPSIYKQNVFEILSFLENVIEVILNQNVKAVLQYCTIPQILYYVLIAIK